MKPSENAQEQLEYLWLLEEDPASAVLPAGANQDYSELAELKLVALPAKPEAVPPLTEQGRLEAAKAIRRHRLAERLMSDVFTTDAALVDEQACGLEHALADDIAENICTLLGHPRLCPHGKPIPQGACCKEARTNVTRLVAPLCELRSGQQGKIAYLHTHQQQHLQKLMAMGVLPGVPLQVKSTFPSIVFEAGYSQFAVDEEIAADIFVRLTSE